MKYVDHTGSSISILFGFMFLLAGISTVSTNPSANSIHMTNLGITLIVGGSIYRSSKNRRHDWGNLHIGKIILEILGVATILFLLLGAGVSYFKNTLYNDPVWPITALITVFAWLVSNMMPKVVGEVVEKKRSTGENFNSPDPKIREDGEANSTASSSRLILRSGLYRAEGADFRIYSSGRISLLKSDIKPLGDDATEFKSIGWFLRAFPDIDISLIRRLGD